MKRIAIFTGAGISAESGIATFRDTNDGLWYNYNIEEVATDTAWKKTPEKVLDFHNKLRNDIRDIQPNEAHKALALLEDKFEVTVITQNIDSLHELAGSTNVLHLHGELNKSRSTKNPKKFYDCIEDIKIGDKAEDGGILRPHTVLFGEMPYNVDEAYGAIHNCDILLIIGTSLQISYTIPLLGSVQDDAEIYYIDPKPARYLEEYGKSVTYIKKKAVEGVNKIVKKLLKQK